MSYLTYDSSDLTFLLWPNIVVLDASCWIKQEDVLYRTADSGSAVDLLTYRCLSTSGLGHFGPGQLVLGTNHFGHRLFPR